MIAAAVFDFCDGFAARLLNAYSDMGKELDSLADLVSFGVLPSIMLHRLMVTCTFTETWVCYIPLIIAVFSGLRLAKFNVDDRQHSSFLGLPTPACAMICGSLCYFVAYEPLSWLATICGSNLIFIPVLSVVLSLLLVSELPMFSMKFSREDSKLLRYKRLSLLFNVILIIAIVAIMRVNWSLAVLLIFVVYVLMNLAFRACRI